MNGREFKTPNFGRRTVLGMGAAASALGLTSGLLPTPASAAPKRGGHAVFVCGNASTTDSLDPEVTPGVYINVLRSTVHDTLFLVAVDGSIEPNLVENVEASDGARVWTMDLIEGLSFHNGASVTGEDVANSLNLHRGEDSKSAGKTILANLETLAVSGRKLTFNLANGDADWPAVLSEYILSILPTVDGAADWRSGIGCGPYRLTSFEPGVSARFERFENDHRSDRGWFDSAELVAVNDTTARINALTSGNAHVAARITPSLATRLDRVANVDVVSRTGPGYYAFEMRTQEAPLADNNVRSALKYAIDREEFVSKILSGYGTVGNDQPIGATYQFAADIEQRAYDPDKSKFYLKKAGLDSLDIELHTADAAFEGSTDAGVLYSEKAVAGGINLSVKRASEDGYWSDTWGQVPFYSIYWNGRATEAGAISLAYAGGAAWNATGFSSERLDGLVAQSRGEVDPAKRGEMLAEAQMILHETGPSVIPAFFNVIDATSDQIGVTDASFSPGSLDGLRAISRWWFK